MICCVFTWRPVAYDAGVTGLLGLGATRTVFILN